MKKLRVSEEEKANSIRNFEELSEILAANYINSSIGLLNTEKTSEEKLNAQNRLVSSYVTTVNPNKVISDKTWKRIILVVGAGASFNAFNNIPLGDHVKKDICKSFKFSINGKSEITFWDIVKGNYDLKQLRKLNPGLISIIQKYIIEFNKLRIFNDDRYNYKEPDFENTLLLLGHFFPIAEIREELFKRYSFRHGPTLYYDIISHLFKHRFIDTIINFNFDELLDQSLEDELGPNGFRSILSDGDIKRFSEYIIDKRWKVPVYIKPHGTFSHKSSLRFTKSHYDLIPQDMQSFLNTIISCDDEDGHAESSILIVFGFAMQSIEFDDILFSLNKPTTIFFIAYSKDGGQAIEKKYKSLRDDDKLILKIIYAEAISDRNAENIQYDKFFKKIWESINDKFQIHHQLTGIDRHLLISKLFGNRKFFESINNFEKYDRPLEASKALKKTILNKSYYEGVDYFLDRTIIETLIEISKKQNSISIQYLLQSKAGRYFQKYHSAYLRERETKTLLAPSYLELLNSLKLNVDYLNDICSTEDLEESVIAGDFSLIIKKTYRSLDEIINPYLKKLGSSTKAIIRSNFQNRYLLILKDYRPEQILHTRLAYEAEILKRIEKNWKFIIVAEDYNTLYNKFNTILKYDRILLVNCKSCPPIVSSNDVDQTFVSNTIHNHHFVLFIDEDNLSEAIYYFQKGGGNTISPIVINEAQNLVLIIEILNNYLSNTSKDIDVKIWQNISNELGIKLNDTES